MNKEPQAPQRSTREQILEAALATLRSDGFAGATSRAIARAGGFNQALVFYHFGTLDGLLLAALDRSSEERLARCREEVAAAGTLEELVALAARVSREDEEGGHMTVVSQMVAGSISRPELAPAMVERLQPWIELVEEALHKGLGQTPLPALLPLRDLAYAVVTFYLGVNLLTHLDEGGTRTDALFERFEQLAPLLGAVIPPAAVD